MAENPVIRAIGEEIQVGVLDVECDTCGERIPVPVIVRADTDEDNDPALFSRCEMADVWAHAWSAHPEESGAE